MPTKKSKTRQAEPRLEETLDPDELLHFFEDHAGTFESYKALQGMFNEYVATGQLQAYTREGLQDFMYHFIQISEVVFQLETLATNRMINKLKAGRQSPAHRKEELLHQAEQLIKAGSKRKRAS